MLIGKSKFLQNSLLLILAIVSFSLFYEHYPRVGWPDAAIYNSYVLVEGAYKYVDGFSEALNGSTYQGTRLGYIVPLRFLSEMVGVTYGRLIYNLILFILYCISVLALTRLYIESQTSQILAALFLLLNPQPISAILYGGADGPGFVFSFVSLTFLFLSLSKPNKLFLFFSGFFLGVSLSAHIFSLLPYALIIFVLATRASLHVKMGIYSGFKSVLSYLFGLALVFSTLGFIGYQLGLSDFYLGYSVGRARNSIQGSGSHFSPPFDFWIKNAILWFGVGLLLVLALFLEGKKTHTNVLEKMAPRRGFAVLCFLFPVLFVVVFDFLIGGSMISAPHYFNAFYPCFAIGVIFLLASSGDAKQVNVKNVSFAFVSILITMMTITAYDNHALFSFGAIRSKDLLRSQKEFGDEVSKVLDPKVFNLVYDAPREVGYERSYVNYFQGKRRVFDYLDTLAFTFPWVGIKTFKVDLSNKSMIKLNIDERISTVALSRTEDELDELVDVIRSSYFGMLLEKKKCYVNQPYQWCMAVVNHE